MVAVARAEPGAAAEWCARQRVTMRILSGLAGKMAPVAGPRGKAVPTPPAAFTPEQHRVIPVSQRRREGRRGAEVQQQVGAATAVAAPHSGSVESDPGRGNMSCSDPSSSPPDAITGGTPTPASSRVDKGSAKQCSRGDPRNPRNSNLGSSGRGTDARQTPPSSECATGDPARKGRGAECQPAASRSNRGSRGSRSRVRQYRKRVCVRWGSLHWSLALVVVVRSAVGCQGTPHHTVTTAGPLTVA
ncbi:hypothetical protein E2C01_057196 [Portunus trituberculatus]|uniref:Uncharacterized protein n=1 Tax=Portunus trituberculatus TaxID=210409 RepID=A0A5B7GW54_PORTR|nr:hypothetical protein [Portunus trituberculatus]